MTKLFAAAACIALLQSVSNAQAQGYPSRPVTMIVPFPAGGPTDTIGRIVAEGMRNVLGQAVIIDNVGGAAGSIATARVARAAADGYTIGLGSGTTHVSNAAVYPLKYDVVADFEPIAMLAVQPMVVVSKKAMPANNLAELIAWLKANPDKAMQGTSGPGSTSHLSGLFFQKETSTRYQFVPYRNTGMPDLMSGLIDLMIDPAANSVPQVQAGTIKAYAVTSKNRVAAIPDVPTSAEAGMPALQILSWHGLWAPKGTPKEIVNKLNAAVVDALANATARKRLADLGQDIPTRPEQTPEALGVHQKAEIAKWWPIIKAANIKVD